MSRGEASAGSVIRSARRAAHLSQVELARQAGTTQSVVSAYESGRREPSVPMLRGLVEAAGYHLSINVEPMDATPADVGLPDTATGRRLQRHRRAITRIAARHGAHEVRVFGSVARGDDTDQSDVDLLVDLADDVGLIGLAGLERELSELLGVDVDVVPADLLKPLIRERAEAEAIRL